MLFSDLDINVLKVFKWNFTKIKKPVNKRISTGFFYKLIHNTMLCTWAITKSLKEVEAQS